MSVPFPALSFPALGTTAVLAVVDAGKAERARSVVERRLREIDAACSRFRPDSELVRLNAGNGSPTRVGPILLRAIEVALEAAATTGGLVDPTVGRAMRLVGYDRSFATLGQRGTATFRPRFEAAPGWQSVEVDRVASAVQVPAGVELDLGATAKALAADLAAHDAAAACGCGVLVSLGGDVAVGGEAPAGGWPIGIARDHRCPPGDVETTVAIASGGLATSSSTVRRWKSAEGELHHLLDPGTGRPCVEVWRSVSVAAASCVAANTATTAAALLGAQATGWLSRRRLPARLVDSAGAVTTTCGWPTGT